MVSQQGLILVTGGTGYIASWIVYHLLEKGYNVRATARTAKLDSMKKTYASFGEEHFQAIAVDDVSVDDLSKALDGVTALIHTATPTPSKETDPAVIFQGHVKSMDHVMTSALKAGVKKIIYTGAFHSCCGADISPLFTPGKMDENDWGKETPETFSSGQHKDPLSMYYAATCYAEKKFWQIAQENPTVDFTSVLPTMVYGGWIPNYPNSAKTIGSPRFAYALLVGNKDELPTKNFPSFPVSAQVHALDVARAHLKALELGPVEATRKRFLIDQGNFTFVQAIQLLKKERPELTDRLPDENDPAGRKQSIKVFDTSLSENLLGMKKKDYVSAEETWLATIDQLVQWEQETDFGRNL